jgi:hypothetical protein
MAGFGDLKVAEARGYEEAHKVVLDACASAFSDDDNKGNCSGFVKAVGDKRGIQVGTTGQGQANDIYDEISGSPWLDLGQGHAGAVKAAYYARQGYFVVAAWKSDSGNGHVAVVTDLKNLQSRGALTDRNVAASWGVLNHADLAQNGGAIRESFGPDKRDTVRYAAQYIKKWR